MNRPSTERPLKVEGRHSGLHSSVLRPDFGASTVLSNGPWDYVAMVLRETGSSESLHAWTQARHFFRAARDAPPVASPLLGYYTAMNATKALLAFEGKSASLHGTSGTRKSGANVLSRELVRFQGNGVWATLAQTLHEPAPKDGEKHNLKRLLRNIPYVHRAFRLTFKTGPELLIPVDKTQFILKNNNKNEACFEARIAPQYASPSLARWLPTGWIRSNRISSERTETWVRRRQSFKWKPEDPDASLERLVKYHARLRKTFVQIITPTNRWYLKKDVAGDDRLEYSELLVTLACLHRFSELARYDPGALHRHLENRHGWLVEEFLRLAPTQFVYRIASELTGREFLTPDAYGTVPV